MEKRNRISWKCKMLLIMWKEHLSNKLCEQSHRRNRLTRKLWMLILALVVEQVEMEENIVDKEIYLDHLLQNVSSL
ncbi:Pvstp1 [Plasmodium coatneyi]|uniref:Pvstp1 n=1 Tax=Plasmodium coatneyi TaxID=208452 RepID=A0A1B1DYJ4_9APIC|nr:Pvstp1 [Plasmodium coatneyi]ANQ07853.1 Pvstp1 [Plasmodium coatneyi]